MSVVTALSLDARSPIFLLDLFDGLFGLVPEPRGGRSSGQGGAISGPRPANNRSVAARLLSGIGILQRQPVRTRRAPAHSRPEGPGFESRPRYSIPADKAQDSQKPRKPADRDLEATAGRTLP